MPRKQPSHDDRREARQPKPAKPGTPIRNSLLLLIFAAILVALVVLLPKEPTRPAAAMLAPGGEVSAGDVEDVPLRISEVMASNKNAYPDDKGNYSDWVELVNTSQEPLGLGGLGLSDREDRVLFIFPEITLGPSERILVYCDDTNISDKDQPLHARFKISALGETIFLFNRSAVVIDSVVVPAINSDFSYALTPNGWITTDQYTPGFPNTDTGYQDFRAKSVTSADGLVINEIVASNVATFRDEDGEYPDWIELYNGGPLTIDLSNYALSDDESDLIKWRFPQGAIIRPNEYFLVFASGKDRPGGDGKYPHANFKLAAEGETVILSDILRQQIDRVTFDNLGKDVSWGRVIGLDNAWQEYQQPTPMLPNNRTSEIEMDARMRASNTSGVFISEVMPSSAGVETPSYGNTSYDWIELVNLSDRTVDLTGYGLSDKLSRPRKWQFGTTSIGPGEHLLVFPSGLGRSPTGSGAIHTTFRLSALGETLVLSDPQGNILDKLVVPSLERDNSYGRNFDHGGLFYYETPTPEMPNTSEGFAGYTTAPSVSLPGGIYLKPVTVTLSAPSDVRIRYTLNGDDPTETVGMDYTGPITISDITSLRVRGFADGLKPSDILTETYLINVYYSLPIVAVTVDNDELYNAETGMLAEDPEVKETLVKIPFKQLAYWQKLPHSGNFEFFLPSGEQMVNQRIEIQLNGQYSMDQPQKSFRITARPRYGSGVLSYPFFDDRPFTEYQAVILRNGGQDGKYTRIIDALQSKIIDWTGADIIHMASRPVIVYLNGDYYGQMNLRERINKYSIAAYEGWSDPDKIDFIKGDNNVISGEFDNYKALRTFVKENDLNDPDALKTVLDWIDVDNYFDFMIFQMYFGNTDSGNIKFYRLREEGEKWRWCVFDLDWGYFDSGTNGCKVWLKPEGSGPQRFDNSIIRGLLAVPEMRDRFLTRYGQLFQEYFADTDRIRALADEMIAVIEPELPMHFQRWAGLMHPLVSSEEPGTPEGLEKYWRDRVSRMHNVLKKRPNLVWQHVQEWFELSDAEMTGYFGPQPEMPDDVL